MVDDPDHMPYSISSPKITVGLLISASLSILLITFGMNTRGGFQLGEPRYNHGDDENAASVSLDDSDWKTDPVSAIKGSSGIVWQRTRIELSDTDNEMHGRIAILSGIPFRLYFDGVLLEKSLDFALPPNREIGLDRFSSFEIPVDHRIEGTHLLAIRFELGESRQLPFRILESDSNLEWFLLPWQWRVSTDDDPHFSERDWDDSTWKRPSLDSFLFSKASHTQPPKGIFWIRAGMIITEPFEKPSSMALFTEMRGSREIYWDGELIGGSGIPGDSRETEIQGTLLSWGAIPSEKLTPGYHQIAIRASANYPAYLDTALLESIYLLDVYENMDDPRMVFPEDFTNVVFVGFAIAACVLFFLVFFFVERESSYLWFASLCLCVAIFELGRIQFEKKQFSYDYDSGSLWGNLILLNFFLLYALLLAFLVSRFRNSKPWIWIGGFMTLSIVFVAIGESIDGKTIGIMGPGLLIGLMLSGWAVFRSRSGGLFALFGVLSIIAMNVLPDGFLGVANVPEFFPMTILLLVGTSVHIGKERERLNASALFKARAEAELLKISIQPHFLVNTLTALIEWVEQEPKKGVEFVKAIERHFDLLLRVSGRDVIPIATELELCESYLKIIGFRKLKRFQLKADVMESESTIPPMILHTLVENATTHNDYESLDEVVFLLHEEECGSRTRVYRLSVPISKKPDLRGEMEETRGIGTQYIKARLSESYGDRYELESDESSDTWTTTIRIFETTKKSSEYRNR